MLGHTSVAITFDRYSHVMPTEQAGGLPARRRAQWTFEGTNEGMADSAATKSPDSRSESGLEGDIGTAYRNRGKRPAGSD